MNTGSIYRNDGNVILPTYKTGYAIDKEDREEIEEKGFDTDTMLAKVADYPLPTFNPTVHPMTLFDPLNQGNQGSCQGHALAMAFTWCFFLLTGQIEMFSRAAAYYLSQRKDGIRGDRGSTLNGGRWVATEHGLCLEEDWKYPSRYNPRQPSGIEDKFKYKLVASKPTRSFEQVREAIRLGLCVQDGIIWNSSVSRSLSTNYVGRGGGGHSTLLVTEDEDGNTRRINSWHWWDGDGCNENTDHSLRQQVESPRSTHIIYAPEGMIYPDREPVTL